MVLRVGVNFEHLLTNFFLKAFQYLVHCLVMNVAWIHYCTCNQSYLSSLCH